MRWCLCFKAVYTYYMKKFLFLILALLFLSVPAKSFAQDIITAEKMITVDTTKQRLYAWESGQIQKEFIVSTGMRYTPTVKGSFKVRRKVALTDMKGSYPPYEPYFIKNVPNVMYFYGAYAIHGTFWHNKFGSRASHGCVNLTVSDSEWLYSWASVGTRVEVF